MKRLITLLSGRRAQDALICAAPWAYVGAVVVAGALVFPSPIGTQPVTSFHDRIAASVRVLSITFAPFAVVNAYFALAQRAQVLRP